MGYRVKNALVGVGVEVTAGSFVEPTVAYPAFDVTYSVSGESFERTESRNWFGKLDSIPGPAKGTLGFKIVLQGAGTSVTTEPYYSLAMRACGFNSAVNSTTNWRFKPVSAFDGTGGNPGPGYSIAIWEDGVRYSLTGAFGSLKIVCAMGKPAILEFSFEGAYNAYVTDTMATPTALGDDGLPYPFLGAGVTIGVTSCVFETLEYNIANTLGDLVDANSSVGIKAVQIIDRRITGRINPEMATPGATDWLQKWRNGTAGAISTGVIGTGVGNQWQILAPRCILRAPSLGERNGLRVGDIEFDVASLIADTDGSDFTLDTK